MPLIHKRHLDSIVYQGGLELVDFCDLILGHDQGLMAFLTQGPQELGGILYPVSGARSRVGMISSPGPEVKTESESFFLVLHNPSDGTLQEFFIRYHPYLWKKACQGTSPSTPSR